MRRYDDAIKRGEEAVELFRKLMETDSGRGCTSDLATSLHNLGAHLNAVGRNTEALQISQEAVALRLTLGETDPVAARILRPHSMASVYISAQLVVNAMLCADTRRQSSFVVSYHRRIPARPNPLHCP